VVELWCDHSGHRKGMAMRFLMSLLVFLAALIAALFMPLFKAVERVVVRPIVAALKAPPISMLLCFNGAVHIVTIWLTQNTRHRGHRLLHIRCLSDAKATGNTYKQLRHQSLGLPTLGMCNAGLGMA